MKPPSFIYVSPKTVQEVIGLLSQHGAEARVLAGGQSLVPIMNLRIMRPAVLIDLNQCQGLDYIEHRAGHVAIGAMTRQIDAMKSPVVRQHCPLVSQALAWTGPVAVRSRATVGGTLAHADRVAELPAVAVALDAVMVIDGVNGPREVAASEFFLGDLTTAIEPGEFLREARFPVCVPGSFSSFFEVSVRQEGVAVVGLAVYLARQGGKVQKAALAAMGVDAAPVRLRRAEAHLTTHGLGDAAIEMIAGIAAEEIDPMSDLYASDAYRKHAIGAMLKKALQNAAMEGNPNER
ncbi:6-hydroxypseudooxynicotine dehydrogenase complex subunit alpha [compost metagenome]